MDVIAVFSILGALLLGAISPGPSFVVVVRTSIGISKRNGFAAALGMGVGGLCLGSVALIGLHTILTKIEWLYFALKLVGGIYLISAGIRLWRGAADPIVVSASGELHATSLAKSFAVAFFTQISNPKTAIVYGSIFAALLPAQPATWIYVVLPLLILLVETCWYLFVAATFSAERPRSIYLRFKKWIDRLAGSVMGALGVQLMIDAGRTG